MKTNQVLVRPMGQFQVEQRTKDSMFNATSLMNQWNNESGQKKNINHYLENTSTKEFMIALIDDEPNIRNSEKPDNLIIARTKVKTNSDGSKIPGEVWMHPIMFIDFAMWLNPAFKVKVIKFVYDQLIKYRNDAGDAYKELSTAIQGIVHKDFMPKAMQKVGEALNWIVFNNHEKMMRNKAGDESTMRELFELERKVADLINDGFINDYDGLIAYLRKKYIEKNNPKVFMS